MLFRSTFTIWSECPWCLRDVESVYVLDSTQWDGVSPEQSAHWAALWQANRNCPSCGGRTRLDFDVAVEDIRDSEEEGLRYVNLTCVGDPGDEADEPAWDAVGCGVRGQAVYKFSEATSL